MLEKLSEQIAHGIAFFFVGTLIAMGQLLGGKDAVTMRLVIGRSLSVGGLAMSAGAILVLYPDLSFLGQIGIAAALASLGASGLERLFQQVLERRG